MDAMIAERIYEMPISGDPVPPYSTDIAEAWRLVDRIIDRGFQLQLSGGRIWKARFLKSVSHTLETQALSATGSTPAEAIGIAALMLYGYDPSKPNTPSKSK